MSEHIKCQRCKHDIIVHWMQQIGQEHLFYALEMEEPFINDDKGEPWPEYRCNCAYGTKPLISYDEYLEIKDSPLYGEYGSGLDVEPYYAAMQESPHHQGSEKKMYGVPSSTDKHEVMRALAERLMFILDDDDRYGVHKGKLYHIHQIIDYGGMQELMPGASPLVDPEAPEELYTFDDDVRYYVVNLTEEI